MLDLSRERSDVLPAREALQTFTLTFAPKVARVHAVNTSLALNLVTLGSAAQSTAGQLISVSQ
jgi:hypothetical protein